MKSKNRLSLPLVLSLLASLGAAQSGSQEKPQAEKPKDAAAKPAAAAVPEAKVKLDLRVTGLTAENQAKVRERLSALTYSAYACEPCGVVQAETGKCPKCAGELAAVKKPMFAAVEPSAADSKLALTLSPEHPTKLSEIESALRPDAVTVDLAAVPIAGHAELVVAGAKADSAPAVEKALADAKLFEQQKARWDTAKSELRVDVRTVATPPTRAKVEAALQPLQLRIKDVIWGRAAMKA